MGNILPIKDLPESQLDVQNSLEMYNNEIHKHPNSYLAYLLKGNCLYHQYRDEESINSYDSALKINPNCIGALYNKSYIEYTKKKDYKAALKNINEALNIIEQGNADSKHLIDLYYAAGLCNFQLKNYENALENFQKSLTLDKQKNYLVYNNIGRCHDKLKNYEKAIEFFSKSFAYSNNKYYIALYNHGLSLYEIKHKKFEAYQIFESIITDYNEEFGPAYFSLGKYYSDINDRKNAIEYFDKAIKYDPNNLESYLLKGNCFNRLKRYSESIDCFDTIISQNPEFKFGLAYYNKANSLKELNRLEDAIQCYQQAILYLGDKKDGDYYYNLGLCQYKVNKFDNALESLNKSIEIKPKWENYFLKGMCLYKKKSKVEAIESFNKSAELNDNFCDIYYKKAQIFYEQGKFADAEGNIDKAIKIFDSKFKNMSLEKISLSDLHYLKGIILRKLKKYDQGLVELKKALDMENEKIISRINYQIGAIYLEKNEGEKCLTFFNEAIKQDQLNFDAYLKKGEYLLSQKKYLDALSSFEKGESINQKSGNNYFLKGKCLFNLRRKNDALYAFEKALKYKERSFFIECCYLKGECLFDLDAFKEAKKVYESVLQEIYKNSGKSGSYDDEFYKDADINKFKENKNYISKIYLKLGLIITQGEKPLLEKAIKYYKISIKYDVNNSSAYYNRGLAYLKLNENEEAHNDFKKTTELNPGHQKVYFKFGNLLYKMKLKDEAIKQFEKAFELNQNDKLSINNKGKCLKDQKKYKEALECFDQSLKIDPFFDIALINKGQVLFELKEYEKAIGAFNKMLKVDKKDKYSYYYISKSYIELNDLDKALETADEGISYNPKFSKILYIKADILFRKKMYKKAKEFCEKALEISPNFYEASTLEDKCDSYID